MKREYKGFVAGLLVAGVIAGTIGTAGAVVGLSLIHIFVYSGCLNKGKNF